MDSQIKQNTQAHLQMDCSLTGHPDYWQDGWPIYDFKEWSNVWEMIDCLKYVLEIAKCYDLKYGWQEYNE